MRLTLGSYREKNPMLDLWREYWGLPALDPRAEAILTSHKAAGADGTHIHLGRDVQVGMYAALLRAWREAGPGGDRRPHPSSPAWGLRLLDDSAGSRGPAWIDWLQCTQSCFLHFTTSNPGVYRT